MKRSALMVGTAIALVAAASGGAWLTRVPEAEPAPPSAKSAAAAEQATSPPGSSAAAVTLPEATPPPPEPTSADFTRRAVSSAPGATGAAKDGASIDWAAMPVDELRTRANADDVPAMEELARRLVHGVGVTKDQQAGAGWLLRAAQRGSAQSAFNVGVMYERGFVVERDSSKAIEWYRKAVDANLAMAKHNLALLLRDGKGAPRNGKEAIDLLSSAARQGMAASMFSLGDIYERGDAGLKDQAIALAWFAIAGEFERQTNRNGDSALARMAAQRAEALRRVLLPGDLERAQQFGQSEFKQIVEGLQPPRSPTPTEAAASAGPLKTSESDADPPGWPKSANDQIRVIQQALIDLRFLKDKPDGAMGPMTRNAIRTFQRSVTARETGEPTRDVYAALQEAITRRDIGSRTPPAKPEAVTPEPPTEAAKSPPAATAALDLGKPEAPPPPPTSADVSRSTSSSDRIDTAKADAARAEALKAEAARTEAAKAEAAKAETAKLEAAKAEAAKAETAKLEAAKAEAAKADAAKAAAAKAEAAKAEAARIEAAKAETAKLEAAKAEAAKADAARAAAAKAEAAKAEAARIEAARAETAKLEAAKAEAAKADAARAAAAKAEAAKAEIAKADAAKAEAIAVASRRDPAAWPTATIDQVKAIQGLLRDLNFSRESPDGQLGPATRAAIRDYERSLGLSQTGAPSKALFESLVEMRVLTTPKSN